MSSGEYDNEELPQDTEYVSGDLFIRWSSSFKSDISAINKELAAINGAANYQGEKIEDLESRMRNSTAAWPIDRKEPPEYSWMRILREIAGPTAAISASAYCAVQLTSSPVQLLTAYTLGLIFWAWVFGLYDRNIRRCRAG